MAWRNAFQNVHDFDPDKSIPDLADKVIIVTGGNAGVGLTTIIQLAKHNPHRLYLAARSQSKFDTAMDSIIQAVPSAKSIIHFLPLDLTSFSSIKSAASTILNTNTRLDILINNAGIMGRAPAQTTDGYEIHFGTNQLGHALLTKLLLPLLLTTASQPNSDVRILMLSSGAAFAGLRRKDPLDETALLTARPKSDPITNYADSKYLNVCYARELSRRYPQILSVSVHPGRVATTLLDDYMARESGLFWYIQTTYDALFGPLTVEKGAWSTLWAASHGREGVKNGAYYVPVGKEDGFDKDGQQAKMGRRLWD